MIKINFRVLFNCFFVGINLILSIFCYRRKTAKPISSRIASRTLNNREHYDFTNEWTKEEALKPAISTYVRTRDFPCLSEPMHRFQKSTETLKSSNFDDTIGATTKGNHYKSSAMTTRARRSQRLNVCSYLSRMFSK